MWVCWTLVFTAGEEFNFVANALVDEVEGLTVFVTGKVSYYCC